DHDTASEAEAARADFLDSGGPPELEQAVERMGAPERADARAEEAPDLAPSGRDHPAGERQPDPHVELPGRPPRPARKRELEHRDRSTWVHRARQLAERCADVLDVAEKVGEREAVERRVVEREALRVALDDPDPVSKPCRFDADAR